MSRPPRMGKANLWAWAVGWAPTLVTDEPADLYFYFWRYYEWEALQEHNRSETKRVQDESGALLAQFVRGTGGSHYRHVVRPPEEWLPEWWD